MEEIRDITAKYDPEYIARSFANAGDLKSFSLVFYKDVAEIYDCITRAKNPDRNPTGFTADDAPVLGLLVRVWKLLKEIIRHYETDNAEIIHVLERPLIEASVTASYLMLSPQAVMEDYRKCSYKDRLRILRKLEAGGAFSESNAGRRLLSSVRERMEFEGFSAQDFAQQKENKWKIQGKNFFQIFSEVEHADLYAATYGMMSEAVHGSWADSVDWSLRRNDEDKTYLSYPFSHPADIRLISPTLRFTNRPFRLWIERIDAAEPYLVEQLDWIERVNTALFRRFDKLFDGP